MNKNIEVLKHCPHFYTIINFEYYSNDVISERLINVYENYIFNVDINNVDNRKKIEKFDEVMYKYISDNIFRNEIKNDIKNIKLKKSDNLLESIVNAILKIFDDYYKTHLKKIPITRWI